MKKEEMKEIVKEAVLEALMQFTTGGVATASEDDPIVIEPGDGEQPTRPDGGEDGEGDDDDDKKKEPLDPGPLIGPAGF